MLERVWAEGEIIREVNVSKPRLASWDRKDHPSQLRLNEYLSELIPPLAPLPQINSLFLDYEICLDDPRKLLSGCDLENYLYPLFGTKWLPAERFVLVSARKRIGNSSRVRIGYALSDVVPSNAWLRSYVCAGSGSSTKECKERIRNRLAVGAEQLDPGPVKVQIAYRCSSRRNWTLLWKPSGDAMGPILGTTREKGFHPCDDRIVELRYHKLIDDSLRNDIHLGYWWQKS